MIVATENIKTLKTILYEVSITNANIMDIKDLIKERAQVDDKFKSNIFNKLKFWDRDKDKGKDKSFNNNVLENITKKLLKPFNVISSTIKSTFSAIQKFNPLNIYSNLKEGIKDRLSSLNPMDKVRAGVERGKEAITNVKDGVKNFIFGEKKDKLETSFYKKYLDTKKLRKELIEDKTEGSSKSGKKEDVSRVLVKQIKRIGNAITMAVNSVAFVIEFLLMPALIVAIIGAVAVLTIGLYFIAKHVVNALERLLAPIYDVIANGLNILFDIIKGIYDPIISVLKSIGNAIGTVIDVITEVGKIIIEILTTPIKLFKGIANLFSGSSEDKSNDISKSLFIMKTDIINSITSLENSVVNTIINLSNNIKTLMSSAISEFRTLISNISGGSFSGVESAINGMVSSFNKIKELIASGIKNNTLTNNLVHDLQSSFVEYANEDMKHKTLIVEKWNKLFDMFTNGTNMHGLKKAIGIPSTIFTGIKDSITSVLSGFKSDSKSKSTKNSDKRFIDMFENVKSNQVEYIKILKNLETAVLKISDNKIQVSQNDNKISTKNKAEVNDINKNIYTPPEIIVNNNMDMKEITNQLSLIAKKLDNIISNTQNSNIKTSSDLKPLWRI